MKSMAPSYPVTPGHEIVGVATHVGRNVLDVSVGDNVAVGCMVDSCFGCRSCRASEEQYCVNGMVLTYGGETKYGRAGPDGRPTHGGFSRRFVANKRFVFKLPRDADLARCAPLLCAGITTYDPLVRLGCAPDAWQFSSPTGRKRVGVVGLGGLGQMAVKLARSFHCEVVALSTSPGKEKTARDIGADHFWRTTDRNLMREKAELAAKAPEREAPVHKSPGSPPAETPSAGLVSDPAPAGERPFRSWPGPSVPMPAWPQPATNASMTGSEMRASDTPSGLRFFFSRSPVAPSSDARGAALPIGQVGRRRATGSARC